MIVQSHYVALFVDWTHIQRSEFAFIVDKTLLDAKANSL